MIILFQIYQSINLYPQIVGSSDDTFCSVHHFIVEYVHWLEECRFILAKMGHVLKYLYTMSPITEYWIVYDILYRDT